MANGLQDIALGLQGFSAGLSGPQALGQFQQQQRQAQLDEERRQQLAQQQAFARQQQQSQSQQQGAEAERARQLTQFTDSKAALDLADQNDWQGVAQIGINRTRASSHFPGVDFSGTQRLTSLAMIASDPSNPESKQAQDMLRTELERNVRVGQSLGVFGEAKQDQVLKASEISESGQVVTRGPGGEIKATDIPGFKSFQRDLKKQERAEAKKAKQLAINVKKIDKDFDKETKLRSEVNNASKDFFKVSSAFDRINASEETGAGDLALIFNFMKMLDPNSVVRESEFAVAENTAGIPERILKFRDKVLAGERLSSAQRQSFLSQSQKLLEAAKASNDKTVGRIGRLAERLGLNPDNVLLRDEEQEALSPIQQQAQGIQGGQVLNFDAQGNLIP